MGQPTYQRPIYQGLTFTYSAAEYRPLYRCFYTLKTDCRFHSDPLYESYCNLNTVTHCKNSYLLETIIRWITAGATISFYNFLQILHAGPLSMHPRHILTIYG